MGGTSQALSCLLADFWEAKLSRIREQAWVRGWRPHSLQGLVLELYPQVLHSLTFLCLRTPIWQATLLYHVHADSYLHSPKGVRTSQHQREITSLLASPPLASCHGSKTPDCFSCSKPISDLVYWLCKWDLPVGRCLKNVGFLFSYGVKDAVCSPHMLGSCSSSVWFPRSRSNFNTGIVGNSSPNTELI